ncbi:MAG: hypothetical protein ACKO3W_11390 [bacterium]
MASRAFRFNSAFLLAFVTVALATSEPTFAAIVHRVVNLAIPANQYGLWLNVETGTTTTTLNGPAGWDFNIYTSGAYASGPAAGGANIIFYTGSTNGAGFMRYPGTTAGTPPKLPAGAIVANYGSFGAGTAAFGAQEGAWKLNADNIVGFKFAGADNQIRYGWARIAVGAASTDRTLVDYAFESTPGVCIFTGAIAGAPPANCATAPAYDPCAPGPLVCVPGSNSMIFNTTTAPDRVIPRGACGTNFTLYRANLYPFDVPTTGTYRIALCDNASDTRLAIFDGCGASANLLACNDNFCAAAAAVDVALAAGSRAWIAVGTATPLISMWTFVPIDIDAPVDPCTSATVIQTGTTVIPVNSAVPSFDMTGYCDPGSVHPATIFKANFARWTAPKTGYYQFGICPSALQVHVAVMTACGDASTVIDCAYDQCPATGGARVGFWADGGSSYVFAFGGQESYIALPATLTIDVSPAEPPPDPCGADLLEAQMGLQSIRLEFEYPDLPLAGSPCTFTIGNQALRYPKYLRFVPPATGPYTMGNCSDTDPNYYGIYDLRIAVMTECGNASTIFACDDNGCHGDVPPWTSRIEGLELEAGVPVYIGLGGNGPAAPGPFAFEITFEGKLSCPGDLDGSGTVDAADLSALLGAWGTPAGDTNGDGTTDASDLSTLLGAWGPC